MDLILSIAVIHLFACLSPGPDIFLVVLNSLRGGRMVGIYTTTGILSGVCLHILLGLTGVSWLLTQGVWVQHAIALAGGLWLMFLGLRGLLHWTRARDKGKTSEVPEAAEMSFSSAWLQGLLVNLLNIKAFLFFVSLFSVMLGPEVDIAIKVSAGITMIMVQAIAFSSVALLVDRPAFKQNWKSWQTVLDRLISIILFSLGAWIWIDILI